MCPHHRGPWTQVPGRCLRRARWVSAPARGEERHLGLACPAAFLPEPGREGTQEAAPGSRGVEGLGRASLPRSLRPRRPRRAPGSRRRAALRSPTWVASHSSSAGTWCRHRCSAETLGLCGSLPSPTRHGQAPPPEEAPVAARTDRCRDSAPAQG